MSSFHKQTLDKNIGIFPPLWGNFSIFNYCSSLFLFIISWKYYKILDQHFIYFLNTRMAFRFLTLHSTKLVAFRTTYSTKLWELFFKSKIRAFKKKLFSMQVGRYMDCRVWCLDIPLIFIILNNFMDLSYEGHSELWTYFIIQIDPACQ